RAIASSPTSSWSSTARSLRRPIGIQGAERCLARNASSARIAQSFDRPLADVVRRGAPSIPCKSFDSLENDWKILGKVWITLGFSLELTLISLSESSLFKGLRGPLGRFFLSAPILPFGLRRAPARPSSDQTCPPR